jgi:ABC-type polysaccharide/polyol phosphate export permease
MWTAALLGGNAYLVDWNPIHHFLELVRAPLLGEMPALLSWEVAAGVTLGGVAMTFAMFTKYRNRIAFWL